MASSIILRVCCGVCPVVTQPGRSGTYAHQLLAAFSKTTAYFISAPFASTWYALDSGSPLAATTGSGHAWPTGTRSCGDLSEAHTHLLENAGDSLSKHLETLLVDV